jgi:hypothetical protein
MKDEMATGIVVRSHVKRDLLQSAALFKTDKAVVWEYVSNSLEYVDPGINPVVKVTLEPRNKRITIQDNGRGMDREGLKNFFIMHGENLDRQAGRRGRGRFGTGKCAAFGIADQLRVSSVKQGTRNTVEISRRDIDASDDSHIPVVITEADVPTDGPNGTTIEICGIKLRTIDHSAVVRNIERHLLRWPGRPLVLVNGHECEYAEPTIAYEEVIEANEDDAEVLGNVSLTIKVAKSPLDPEMRGVAIFARGVWLETTLAGAEGQPLAQYIFGDIDVPKLDDEQSPIPAYDMSRSMELNRSNEVVQAVLALVGREVERVRRKLVEEDKNRRSQLESRRLQAEATSIAEMINEDFHDFSKRIARVRARAGGGPDSGSRIAGDVDGDDVVAGGSVGAVEANAIGDIGHGGGVGGQGTTPPNMGPSVTLDDSAVTGGEPAGNTSGSRRRRGGFHVEFKGMGADTHRAYYAREERTIYINLDHPQIAAAKGAATIDDPTFLRLAYEVAFSEYAIALASELADNNEYIDPSDPIFDIREAVNRLARRAASLYAN